MKGKRKKNEDTLGEHGRQLMGKEREEMIGRSEGEHSREYMR